MLREQYLLGTEGKRRNGAETPFCHKDNQTSTSYLLPPSFEPVLEEVDRMSGILDFRLGENKSISPLPPARSASKPLR